MPEIRNVYGRTRYAALIDGEWDAEGIVEFPKKFQQAYLAIYAYGRQREVKRSTHNYPWKGGFSAVNFYNNLRVQVPVGARPELGAFVYSSPGYVKWNVDQSACDDVRSAIARLKTHREPIQRIVKFTYKAIREFGLNDNNAVSPSRGSEVNEYLGELFDELIEALGSIDGQLVRSVHYDNFICIKIVLSIHTRLLFLYELSANGMVEY